MVYNYNSRFLICPSVQISFGTKFFISLYTTVTTWFIFYSYFSLIFFYDFTFKSSTFRVIDFIIRVNSPSLKLIIFFIRSYFHILCLIHSSYCLCFFYFFLLPTESLYTLWWFVWSYVYYPGDLPLLSFLIVYILKKLLLFEWFK